MNKSQGPKHLTVFPTNKCNFRCWFCKRTHGELDTTMDIDIKTVEYTLDKFPSIKGCCLAGFGEPLLYPKLEQLVGMLRARNLCVRISTNGALILNNKELIKRMNVYEYSVSINSANSEQHERVHGVKNQFDNVIRGLNFLKNQVNTNVNATFVCHRNNYMQIPEFIRLFSPYVDTLHFFNLLPHNMKYYPLTITDKDADIIANLKSYKRNFGSPKVLTWPNPIAPDKYQCGTCDAPDFHMLLAPDGHVSGCIRMRPPSSDFGSIYDEDPWNGRCYQNLRNQKAFDPVCKICLGHYAFYNDKYGLII